LLTRLEDLDAKRARVEEMISLLSALKDKGEGDMSGGLLYST